MSEILCEISYRLKVIWVFAGRANDRFRWLMLFCSGQVSYTGSETVCNVLAHD